MSRVATAAAWTLAATLCASMLAWTNLTGLGIGANPLTYDDLALARFVAGTIGISAVWFLLALMIERGNPLSVDNTLLALGALALWSVLSAAFAGTTLVWLGQSERLEGVATMFLYALAYGAGLQVGRARRVVRTLAATVAVCATLLAVHGLLQVIGLDPTSYLHSGSTLYLGSAFASLSNPNFLAGVLVIALPIAGGLAASASSTLAKWSWAAIGAVILAALYATYSQGAWLGAVVQLAIAVALWVVARGRVRPAGEREADSPSAGRAGAGRTRLAWLVSASIVLVGVIIIVAVTGVATSRGLRLWGSSLSETGSGRILLVQTTAGAVADKPVLGFGADNYLEAFLLHRPDRFVEVFGEQSTTNNAHFWLLQYAATLGVVGALLLAAALGMGLWRARPVVAGESEQANALQVAIWLGLVGYAVQMMFNVAVLASTVPFWVLMGALCAPRARRMVVEGRSKRVLTVATATLLAVSILGGGALISADALYMASRDAYWGDAPGDPVALAGRAAQLNPLSIKYARGEAQARSALVSQAIEGGGSAQDVRRLHDEAVAAFERTLSRSPRDYAAHSWLAGLHLRVGTHLGDQELVEEAFSLARTAATLDRTHWSVVPLLDGDTSDGAARLAALAPPLP